MDDLKDFNADKARNISNVVDETELYEVLFDINIRARNKLRHMTVYKQLSYHTRKQLIIRGFKVDDMEGIAIQKDGVYHQISW